MTRRDRPALRAFGGMGRSGWRVRRNEGRHLAAWRLGAGKRRPARRRCPALCGLCCVGVDGSGWPGERSGATGSGPNSVSRKDFAAPRRRPAWGHKHRSGGRRHAGPAPAPGGRNQVLAWCRPAWSETGSSWHPTSSSGPSRMAGSFQGKWPGSKRGLSPSEIRAGTRKAGRCCGGTVPFLNQAREILRPLP